MLHSKHAERSNTIIEEKMSIQRPSSNRKAEKSFILNYYSEVYCLQ